MITTVTITGADDSITPQDLINLQNQFPFVEWGILFSTKRTGTPRYPSEKWLDNFFSLNHKFLGLSAHLCGDFAKGIILAGDGFLKLAGGYFNRIQINHNFTNNPLSLDKLHETIEAYSATDFIIQKNVANNDICKEIENCLYTNVNFLYDASGGRGTRANFLDAPIPHHFTGYAGGLSPENVEGEIVRINEFVGNTNVWIDMETHVRSNNDTLFDLKKVEKVLSIAERHIPELAD